MLFWLTFTAVLWASPAPVAISPGAPALVFELPAANARAATRLVQRDTVALTALAGTIPTHPHEAVVVYFFRTQDDGSAMQELERVRRRFQSRGVAVLAIATDQPDFSALAAWTSAQNVRFPVLHDAHQIVSSRYAVATYPLTIVIDRDGRLFAVGQPKSGEVEKELSAELEGLLSSAGR